MKKSAGLISIIFIAFNLSAQITETELPKQVKIEPAKDLSIMPTTATTTDTGKVTIQEDLKIGVLVQKYNSAKKDIGYRVQIHSGLARMEAINAQSNFLKLYPDVPSYLIYQQPNFKIRVGDFENRIEVLKFHDEMQMAFPGSFVIKDEINPQFNQ